MYTEQEQRKFIAETIERYLLDDQQPLLFILRELSLREVPLHQLWRRLGQYQSVRGYELGVGWLYPEETRMMQWEEGK